MDQGIIVNLKVLYREAMLKKLICSIDGSMNDPKKFTLLVGLPLLRQAWRDVKKSTIVNCFRTCGFQQDVDMENKISDPEIKDNISLAAFPSCFTVPAQG